MRRICLAALAALTACSASEPRHTSSDADDNLPDRHFTTVLAERARDAADRDRTKEEAARALTAMAEAKAQVESLAHHVGDTSTTTLDALHQVQWSAERAEANAKLATLRARRADLLKMVEQQRILERYRRRARAPSPSILY